MYAWWIEDWEEINLVDTEQQAHDQVAEQVHKMAYYEAGEWLTYYTVELAGNCIKCEDAEEHDFQVGKP